MNQSEIQSIIEILSEKGIEFDSGLTDKEIQLIETKFQLVFPPDLSLFLQTALPSSKASNCHY